MADVSYIWKYSNISFIRLSSSTISILFLEVYPNASTVPISFMAFQDASLFQTSNVTSEQMSSSLSNKYIGSHVLAVKIEVNNIVIRELPTGDTVVARFPVPVSLLFTRLSTYHWFLLRSFRNKSNVYQHLHMSKISNAFIREILVHHNGISDILGIYGQM